LIVTFLGTGTSQGVPDIGCQCTVCRSLDYRDKRLRTSVHVQTDNGFSIIIDTGPDFRQQMLSHRIRRINAVLYTHEHKDHTAGLDDIRAFNYLQKENIPVYGEERVIERLKNDFSYVIEPDYPGVPQVDFHTIQNQAFILDGIEILPIRVFHYNLPVFGFRIKEFTYITDAKTITPNEMEKLKGSKIMVVNALRKEAHISHFTLQEAIELIHEVKPETAYLTHISHRLGLHKDVENELPKNVYLAYDGLKVKI
jgi:phosphoribosyl 1,2-cyclic phosphate phosphodiesterase